MGSRLLVQETRIPIPETGWLGDAIFTAPTHAHMHLPAPQYSTAVGEQRHLVENGAIPLSPAQLGPTSVFRNTPNLSTCSVYGLYSAS